MSNAELLELAKSGFEVIGSRELLGVLNIDISPADNRKALEHMKEKAGMDSLSFLTALDWPQENAVEMIYYLACSISSGKVVLRAKLPGDKPSVHSASDIYSTAEWHEREAGEMFGIHFEGHPDPRPILLPDAFQGHPLRKGFTHPNSVPLP